MYFCCIIVHHGSFCPAIRIVHFQATLGGEVQSHGPTALQGIFHGPRAKAIEVEDVHFELGATLKPPWSNQLHILKTRQAKLHQVTWWQWTILWPQTLCSVIKAAQRVVSNRISFRHESESPVAIEPCEPWAPWIRIACHHQNTQWTMWNQHVIR